MESTRFDRFAMRLAKKRVSRRTALRSGLLGSVASALSVIAARAQATPAASNAATPAASGMVAADNSTLFVQTATGGIFRPNPEAGATPVPAATPGNGLPVTQRRGDWLLTLTGHSGETIAFSDRPQRQYGEVATHHFFASMGFTPVDPPNAALVADTETQQDDVLLLELMNPGFDAASQTLTYEADILQNYEGEELKPMAARQQDDQMAPAFGSASLFIDDCPNTEILCFTPASLMTCAPIGNVRNVGTCWHWACLCCSLCSGSPGDICAAHFPDTCGNGECTGMTFSQWLQVCNTNG